jgi:hypothetical protein
MCDVGCNKLGASAEGRQDARHDIAAGSPGTVGEPRFDDEKRVASSPAPLGPKTGSGFARQTGGWWWGLSAPKRASDSLKPSGAHLATKARLRPFGDPTRIRLWGSGHCLLLHVELEQSCEPPVGAAAHEVLGT